MVSKTWLTKALIARVFTLLRKPEKKPNRRRTLKDQTGEDADEALRAGGTGAVLLKGAGPVIAKLVGVAMHFQKTPGYIVQISTGTIFHPDDKTPLEDDDGLEGPAAAETRPRPTNFVEVLIKRQAFTVM